MMDSPIQKNHDWRSLADCYARLFRWHQPIGIWLLLWPCLIALWIASHGQPEVQYILLFTLGCVVSRSAGCVVNDLCDRTIDMQVTRTKNRPLVRGELSVVQALLACIVCLIICLLIALYIGGEVWILSVFAVVALSVYPLSKRFFSHPQIVLSITYGLGIPMAWVAGGRSLSDSDWLWLYLSIMCWVYAYDTIYAMADKPDDAKIGVHSSAMSWGRYDWLGVALAQAMTLLLLSTWVYRTHGGYLPYLALVVITMGFCWQHWYIRRRTSDRCIVAFRSNHLLQLLLLLATIADSWF